MITYQRLRELLIYCPETGKFSWRGVRANRLPEQSVGWISWNGYHCLGVDNHIYRAHRLAWLYVTGEWPKADIDHINGTRSDNRWNNLREATRGQNLANKRMDSRNTSGFKGVSWSRKCKKWQAHIKVNRKSQFLGFFESKEMAHMAYCEAAAKNFGEFARPETPTMEDSHGLAAR